MRLVLTKNGEVPVVLGKGFILTYSLVDSTAVYPREIRSADNVSRPSKGPLKYSGTGCLGGVVVRASDF